MDHETSRELVDAARECVTLRHAWRLVDWVAAGKQVTGNGLPRRGEIADVGQVLGLGLPDRPRTAADLPELNRPWVAALGVGFLTIENSTARSGPRAAEWAECGDDEVLEQWLRGLVEVLVDAYGADAAYGPVEICRVALAQLSTEPEATGEPLWDALLHQIVHTDGWLLSILDAAFGHRHPVEVLLEVLAGFGAVAEERITPLGHWALNQLNTRGATLTTSVDADVDTTTIYQLKITLLQVRPSCWRRVLVPASSTLGTVHDVIRIALDWGSEHLHGLQVGNTSYGDPAFDIGDDEDTVTLAEVFTRRRKKISYIYDFGDTWRHEITLERTVDPDPEMSYPVCTGGRGSSPLEDQWDYDDATAWKAFSQDEINASLAELADEDAAPA